MLRDSGIFAHNVLKQTKVCLSNNFYLHVLDLIKYGILHKTINFKQLANQIAEVTDNVWKLYDFIYKNKDLALLNESLLFGHSSLKAHVLLISNLIVSDYLNNKFK